LDQAFWSSLISEEVLSAQVKSAKKTQKIDNGINAQKRVFELPAEKWSEVKKLGEQKNLFQPKELSVLSIAEQIPKKIPSEKQCVVLLQVLQKAELEGILA
ncbi:MAG: AIPR family protein, partial [Hyphomicrobiales bacterium]